MAQYGVTLLRLTLGAVFIMHAYLALFVFGPSGMVEYQIKNNIPFPQLATWFLILAHGLGGILLVLGVLVRWAALANVVVMIGAVVFVHWAKGFWAFNGGYEYALVLVLASVAQALLGPGAFTFRK